MQTRIQRLINAPGDVWIKRDDELGFGTTGSKTRKWATLIPALLQRGVTDALVEGGSRSNNSIVAAQLLRQHGITPRFMFRQSRDEFDYATINGNRFLIELLTHSDEVRWLGRICDDEYREQLACYRSELEMLGKNVVVIPEGASCPESLAGAITLGEDLERNERESGIDFERVFIDSGTGMTAIGCMLGMAKRGRKPLFEIVLIAGTATSFETELARLHGISRIEAECPPYRLHHPRTGKSFGAVTSEILGFVASFARSEGILIDPVYTAKLFHTAYALLANEKPSGASVLVHTGGGTTLFGFADRLLVPRTMSR